MGDKATKNMLIPHQGRKTLFDNITFIFVLQEHLQQMEQIITLAGGFCVAQCNESRTIEISTEKCIAIELADRFKLNSKKTKKAFDKFVKLNEIQIVHEREIIISMLQVNTDNLFKNPNRIQASIKSFFKIAPKSNAILDESAINDEKVEKSPLKGVKSPLNRFESMRKSVSNVLKGKKGMKNVQS